MKNVPMTTRRDKDVTGSTQSVTAKWMKFALVFFISVAGYALLQSVGGFFGIFTRANDYL